MVNAIIIMPDSNPHIAISIIYKRHLIPKNLQKCDLKIFTCFIKTVNQ